MEAGKAGLFSFLVKHFFVGIVYIREWFVTVRASKI
jgi:hypothetical protein